MSVASFTPSRIGMRRSRSTVSDVLIVLRSPCVQHVAGAARVAAPALCQKRVSINGRQTLRQARGERNSSLKLNTLPLVLSLSKHCLRDNRHPQKRETCEALLLTERRAEEILEHPERLFHHVEHDLPGRLHRGHKTHAMSR